MATIILKVEIKDEALTKTMMEDGFLEVYSMPQIPDPNWVDPEDGSTAPLVDKFVNVKELAEDKMADWIIKIINRGLTKKHDSSKQVFTKDMIV